MIRRDTVEDLRLGLQGWRVILKPTKLPRKLRRQWSSIETSGLEPQERMTLHSPILVKQVIIYMYINFRIKRIEKYEGLSNKNVILECSSKESYIFISKQPLKIYHKDSVYGIQTLDENSVYIGQVQKTPWLGQLPIGKQGGRRQGRTSR